MSLLDLLRRRFGTLGGDQPLYDPEKVKALFLHAVEEHPPGERNSFLDQACSEDGELRRQVEILVEAHDRAGSFLEEGAAAPASTINQPITEALGTQIGTGGQQQKPVVAPVGEQRTRMDPIQS